MVAASGEDVEDEFDWRSGGSGGVRGRVGDGEADEGEDGDGVEEVHCCFVGNELVFESVRWGEQA